MPLQDIAQSQRKRLKHHKNVINVPYQIKIMCHVKVTLFSYKYYVTIHL